MKINHAYKSANQAAGKACAFILIFGPLCIDKQYLASIVKGGPMKNLISHAFGAIIPGQ